MNHFLNGESNKEIPHHKQMIIGSCGPACVIMFLKHFKSKIRITKKLELRLWSKSWLIPFGATDEYGLGYSLGINNIKAEIITENIDFRLKPKSLTMRMFCRIFGESIERTHRYNRNKALESGIKEKVTNINLNLIQNLLKEKTYLIIMVDQSKYISDDKYKQGILHWIVITGYDKMFRINDPDIGQIEITPDELEKSMELKFNFGIDKRMIAIRE